MKYYLLSYVVILILKLWFLFNKSRINLSPGLKEILNRHGMFILCGWHNNIATFTPYFASLMIKKFKYQTSAMVSASKDGEMIKLLLDRFGIETVRGSSSKGGSAAFRKILKNLKTGKIPVLTPDGPRGPAYKVKPGIVQLASISGLPVIMFGTISSDYHEFKNSWDKHRFPGFGSTIFIDYSEPLYIPKLKDEGELQKYCHLLENKMMDQVENLKKMILT